MAGNNKKAAGAARPNLGNLLNLERVPMLAPKFANKLGKDAAGYAVLYSEEGVRVMVQCKLNEKGLAGPPLAEGQSYPQVSLVEFERRVALKNQPSADERLASLRKKFELRLNQEFPATGPKNGSEESVQAWLGSRPFAERRALLMSQKDFDKSFPNGFRTGA